MSNDMIDNISQTADRMPGQPVSGQTVLAGVPLKTGNAANTSAAPGKGGRGAMFICPECGARYARTVDGQSKCIK